jgi:chemotaxis protein CheD
MTLAFAPSEAAPPGAEPRPLHVIQGCFEVTDDARLMMTTVLGSCVAACINDPVARVGGMNHFLLPGAELGDGVGEGLRYGVHAMELLVNALLRKGARRERLQVKLFGGGRMFDKLADVGAQNAAFAERFVRDEGLAYAGGSLGGGQARRVQYWPVSGRARQALLAPTDAEVLAAESRRMVARPPADDGGVELF